MRVLKIPQLCLVTNPDLPDLLVRVEQALVAGVTMVQLRGHSLDAATLYQLASKLQPLCRNYEALFLVNDRLDVGKAVGADGFQLGRRSIPIAVARRLCGEDALLGASVHSLAEAESAVQQGADFLLAGIIFASTSHIGEEPNGLPFLQHLKMNFPKMPLLAIGGITEENAIQVREAGADGIAAISSILAARDIAGAVERLRSALAFI
jgi:thiamine-phosphate diphosphorylase